MSPPSLQLRGHTAARLSQYYQQPIGRILVDMGAMSSATLLQALAIQNQCKAPLHQVCLAEGFATAEQILRAQAAQHAALALTLEDNPPDPDCAKLLDPLFCLEHSVMPWARLGKSLVLATSRPDSFEAVLTHLPDPETPTIMSLATESDIHAAIAAAHSAQLVTGAEESLPEQDSCREMRAVATRRQMYRALLAIVPFVALLIFAPLVFYGVLAFWAMFTMMCQMVMKMAACIARLQGPLMSPMVTPPVPTDTAQPPPKVSILVPLFHERDIASNLVKRLSRLTYPKSALDVVLVLEAEDDQTRATLAQSELPAWMRIIAVPPGQLTTKPRAMNYALKFCDGEIIGIYDAEDDPAPDQIERVVDRFKVSPPEVVCLQGILDYYNPRANWLARCFTIEYATWFRVVLPGLARLGFVIPLGGTTLFFRRTALEKLGGWDAYNVTEDADLGMRLARHGYRTEMIETVTLEEANCRWWPWVRQRSRWLKGYMATYRVHMRNPRRLLGDLGLKRFIGFQILFLGALSQFLMAPVLWSFWSVPLGLGHPFLSLMGPGMLLAAALLFLLSEILNVGVSAAAVASRRHRHLLPWIPTLLFYFPLGAVAAYKALAELVSKPFYWDKTEHGHRLGAATVAHENED